MNLYRKLLMRHCEERSDEAIQVAPHTPGLLRCALHEIAFSAGAGDIGSLLWRRRCSRRRFATERDQERRAGARPSSNRVGGSWPVGSVGGDTGGFTVMPTSLLAGSVRPILVSCPTADLSARPDVLIALLRVLSAFFLCVLCDRLLATNRATSRFRPQSDLQSANRINALAADDDGFVLAVAQDHHVRTTDGGQWRRRWSGHRRADTRSSWRHGRP